MAYIDDDVSQSGGLYRGLRMARTNPNLGVDQFMADQDGRRREVYGVLSTASSAYREMVERAYESRQAKLNRLANEFLALHGKGRRAA